jgi:putative transposase
MVAEARKRGLELTGPDGLLKLFTKDVLEMALNEEMTEHLRHEKNHAIGLGMPPCRPLRRKR